eukprot:1258346-Pyramimonas_sp.AAC.1
MATWQCQNCKRAVTMHHHRCLCGQHWNAATMRSRPRSASQNREKQQQEANIRNYVQKLPPMPHRAAKSH